MLNYYILTCEIILLPFFLAASVAVFLALLIAVLLATSVAAWTLATAAWTLATLRRLVFRSIAETIG